MQSEQPKVKFQHTSNWLLERRKLEEQYEKTNTARRLEGTGEWLIGRERYVQSILGKECN